MKDRVVLFSTLTLLVTVALFAWFTWARWGVVGLSPGLRWLVFGSAFFALAAVGLSLLSRRRAARAEPRSASPAPIAFRVAPSEKAPEGEKTTVTAVEIK